MFDEMKGSKAWRTLGLGLACAAIAFSIAPRARAQSETIIYSPQGTNGDYAAPSVWAKDGSGNLYGVTWFAPDFGTVFELSPAASGWTETTLYSFQGAPDGQEPSGLVRDAAGNLYGTTLYGGSHNTPNCIASCGIVFELSPTSQGTWMETILYEFTGKMDGGNPFYGLVLDRAGNLYGVTLSGGAYQVGTVFKLSPSNGGWTFTRLYTFGDGGENDLSVPSSNVALDSAGNLYGTSPSSGRFQQGAVYKLTPTASGDWKETFLHEFGSSQSDGTAPFGGVILDAKGNVYGTTSSGGGPCSISPAGCGTVFELSLGNSGWKEFTLYRFRGFPDANSPEVPLIFDKQGNLYGGAAGGSGTTDSCQAFGGCGAIFKLTPTPSGWKESILHSFAGPTDGYQVVSSPIFGPREVLYGGTEYGGTGQCTGAFGVMGCGAIYALQP
jgi:uncharacterized repeat protein (TIGR03803 family)